MGEGSVSWISLLTRFLGRWKLSRKIQAPSGILHNYEVFKAIDANQSYHTEALKFFCYHLVTSFCEVNCSWEIMHLTLDSKGAQLRTVLWRSCTCRVRGGGGVLLAAGQKRVFYKKKMFNVCWEARAYIDSAKRSFMKVFEVCRQKVERVSNGSATGQHFEL